MLPYSSDYCFSCHEILDHESKITFIWKLLSLLIHYVQHHKPESTIDSEAAMANCLQHASFMIPRVSNSLWVSKAWQWTGSHGWKIIIIIHYRLYYTDAIYIFYRDFRVCKKLYSSQTYFATHFWAPLHAKFSSLAVVIILSLANLTLTSSNFPNGMQWLFVDKQWIIQLEAIKSFMPCSESTAWCFQSWAGAQRIYGDLGVQGCSQDFGKWGWLQHWGLWRSWAI